MVGDLVVLNAGGVTVFESSYAERKFGQVHAFPAVTNGPSNKICEKNGFTNLGECEFEFAGRRLRCHHGLEADRLAAFDQCPDGLFGGTGLGLGLGLGGGFQGGDAWIA